MPASVFDRAVRNVAKAVTRLVGKIMHPDRILGLTLSLEDRTAMASAAAEARKALSNSGRLDDELRARERIRRRVAAA